jgi:hypothetical protein
LFACFALATSLALIDSFRQTRNTSFPQPSTIDTETIKQSQETDQRGEETPKRSAKKSGILEYRSIPWENNNTRAHEGDKNLTVNLALWWLYMMAAKDSSIRWLYGPLEEENLRIEPEEAYQSSSFSAVSIDSQSQSSVTERKRKRQTEDDVD